MGVYTEVSDEDLNTFIAQYPLGAVLSCKGIAEGVENSNYLLVTETGPYILTLYEKRTRRGRSAVLPGADGAFWRPRVSAVLSPFTAMTAMPCGSCAGGRRAGDFLSGMWPPADRTLPLRLGEAMGTLRTAGADFSMKRPNDLSVSGWRPLFDACAGRAHEVRPGAGGSAGVNWIRWGPVARRRHAAPEA